MEREEEVLLWLTLERLQHAYLVDSRRELFEALETLNQIRGTFDVVEQALAKEPHSWAKFANCRNIDEETRLMFFEPYGYSMDDSMQDNLSTVKGICRFCLVRVQCLGYALENAEPFGVWGGLTALERLKLKGRGRFLEVAVGSHIGRHPSD
jgi:WhiB family redox-sensing transcriptional regulator